MASPSITQIINEAQPEPSGILLGYQRRWVADRSKLKIWLKSRQIGFSFASTLETTLDCCERKTLWLVLSAGQRQSLELAQKAKDHIDAIGTIERAAARTTLDQELWGVVDGVEVTQATITFRNDARMLFLPAKPETVRGYSGNVLADEFAFHQNAKQIYASVYPSTTRGYRILVGSTPFGESGMFYDLYSRPNGFSKHCTTIYDAIEDGIAESIGADRDEYLQQLRDGCPDDDIWEQEYCCKFLSDATSYIPWEMILGAETDGASIELPEYWIPTGDLYLGGDIGRHKDLSVFVLIERVGDVYWIREIKRMRKESFAAQKAHIRSRMTMYRIRRYCQDASGLGMQLAEEMVQEFGESRAEGVTFNLVTKEDMAVRTRRVYEDRRLRAPVDRLFRSAVHAVRRIATAGGHFRFDADRTDAGHADEFWGLSLALLAADGAKISTSFAAPARPSSYSASRGYV